MRLLLPPSVNKSAAYISRHANPALLQFRTAISPERLLPLRRPCAAIEVQGPTGNDQTTYQQPNSRHSYQLRQPLTRALPNTAQTQEEPRRPTASRISSSNLTRQIKACREWQELVQFYNQQSAQFNTLNMLAFINTFTKVKRSKKMTRFEDTKHQAFVSSVVTDLLSAQHLPNLTFRGLANVLWALGKLGMSPGLVSLNIIQDILCQQLTDATQCDPTSLSQIIWGMAKLNHNPSSQFLIAYLTEVNRQLSVIAPQGLSNILWAFASLKVSSPELHTFLESYITSSIDTLPLYSPQGLANTYWALAELDFYPGGSWLQACWQASISAVHSFNALDVSQMLKAAAKFKSKATPPSKWIAALLPCCVSSRQQPLGPTEFVTTLFSLASIGYQPPRSWMQPFLDKGHGSLKHMSAQEASNLVWALARLKARTRLSFQRDWFNGSFNCLPYMNAQDYAHVVCSLGYLQWETPLTWIAALQEGLFKQLPFLKPSHMALLANGWARIGSRPADVWLERFFLETAQLLDSSSNQELCTTLYWLARGRLRPPEDWITAWMKASSAKLGSFTGQELANSICALRWTQANVPSSWMDSYLVAAHIAAQRRLQRQFSKVLNRIDDHAKQLLQKEEMSGADVAVRDDAGSNTEEPEQEQEQQEHRRFSKQEHQKLLYEAALRRYAALKAACQHASISTSEANTLLNLRDAAVISWALAWFEQRPPLTVHILSKIAQKYIKQQKHADAGVHVEDVKSRHDEPRSK